jgi:hypothetical protein
MPGIMSIHTDAKGVAHWKIEADIPFVGPMMTKFATELSENRQTASNGSLPLPNSRISFVFQQNSSKKPRT